jgi:hypothetical protein
VRRADAAGKSLLVLNFAAVEARAAIPPDSGWQTALDTADDVWRGPGSALPASFVAGTEAIVTLQPHSAVLLLAGT